MSPLVPGLGLITFAAACNGAFALPLKLLRRFQWENSWVLTHLFAMILLPLIAAKFFLPDWPQAIAAVGIGTVATVMAFGFLWGVGSVTFAIGINAVGISLGYALIMGTIMVSGSIVPLVRRWEEIPGDARLFVLLGIAVCTAGVAVCGKAGMLRESAINPAGAGADSASLSSGTGARAFTIGLAWCILSGILSAANNIGFDFADRVAQEATRLGAHPLFASLGRWIVLYWGGYLAVLIFAGSKMFKTGSWKNYARPGARRDAVLSVIMGSLHFSSQITYGMGVHYIGRLGTSVGFAIMLAVSIMLANLLGFVVTGEWKGAVRRSVLTLYLGLAILIVAVLILAYGNSLVPSAA